MDKRDKAFMTEVGDAWFERNHVQKELEIPMGCKLFEKAVSRRLEEMGPENKILEIGCSCGYNLLYLCEKYHLEGYGLDPSKEAIDYGNDKIQKAGRKGITLKQGSADDLPFENQVFDIVILGFCMYCIDRKYILRVISEVDRILKEGGIVAISDFETTIPYRRPNKHHENLWTYKYDMAQLFIGNPQYTLMEKRSFFDNGEGFAEDMQERCAVNILYKERIKDVFILQE